VSGVPRLYLAGLSGSGKTTVAALAARWLGARAGDVDAEVERATGRTVTELWAAGGEAAFRAAERGAVERLTSLPGPAVIALGGGTLEGAGNRERLARWGEGVWLDAPAADLALRIGDRAAERPLLAGRDPARRLRDLAAERGPRYAALPHRVAADGRPPEAVAVAAIRAVSPPETAALGDGVRCGRAALALAGELLAERCPGAPRGPLAVVTDGRVWRLHGRELAAALAIAGWDARPVELEEGERAKAPDALLRIWQSLAAEEAGRDTPLAVLGGGALGDVGGLAASTFKRGLPLALFPTTLLAQVDAAIGGKNAIDLGGVKNVVGTFHEPALVTVDPLCPLTQDERGWRSGWAEVVKSGLIGDPDLFALCEREVEAIGERRLAVVEEAVERAAKVKLAVVGKDPREAGPRRALNLGHTLGHAFESEADGALTHGEAVAIGLAAAARFSEGEGVAETGLAERVESALAALGLPVRPAMEIDPARLLALVRHDKKRKGGAVHAVLIVRPGETEIRALDDSALARWVEEAVATPGAGIGGRG
jgi:3-dehydroquinate synthetase/shikimate kinase